MPSPVNRKVVLGAQKLRQGIVIQERTRYAENEASEAIVNPATVATEVSITKNMDNYESMKVGVVISSPCHNTDEAKTGTHNDDLALAMKLLEKEAALVSSEWF